jgi:hypothetical protein
MVIATTYFDGLLSIAYEEVCPPVEAGERVGSLGDLKGARLKRETNRRLRLKPLDQLVVVLRCV